MSASEDIDAAILANVTGPKRVSSDDRSIEQQSVDDQIKAQRHLASQDAAAASGMGIRFMEFVPRRSQ